MLAPPPRATLRLACSRVAVASLAAALCGCGRTQLAQTRPHASVSPLALDFGNTPVLFPAQQNLTVEDAGNAPLHVASLALGGTGAAAFSVDVSAADLAPAATLTRAVIFRPTSAGPYAATLTVASDDPDAPALLVALSGQGVVGGALAVAPAALAFDRVGEGEAELRTLTLTSTGTSDLYLGGISFTSASAAAYGFVGSPHTPSTLPAGQSVQLAVRFAPLPGTASGAGAVAIDTSDPGSPRVEVPLSASINRAPLAVARGSVGSGAPGTVRIDTAVGVTVQLDGSGSSDPDGDLPLAYAWTLTAAPTGSTASLSAPASASAAITLDQPGVYSLSLLVKDATGLPALLPARLDLRAVPPEQLVVQLVWDALAPDLDLHLLQQGAAPGSTGDCGWVHPDPAWFSGGADENPHYGGDQLVGYGPETITWKHPTPGTYLASVLYMADHGAAAPATSAQLRVYSFGVLSAELSRSLPGQGTIWDAAVIDWPSGVVTAQARAPAGGARR